MSKLVLGIAIGAAIVGAATGPTWVSGVIPAAHAGQAGCKVLKYQFAQQAEAELGEIYGQGGTIVSFWKEPTAMPYNAFACTR